PGLLVARLVAGLRFGAGVRSGSRRRGDWRGDDPDAQPPRRDQARSLRRVSSALADPPPARRDRLDGSEQAAGRLPADPLGRGCRSGLRLRRDRDDGTETPPTAHGHARPGPDRRLLPAAGGRRLRRPVEMESPIQPVTDVLLLLQLPEIPAVA